MARRETTRPGLGAGTALVHRARALADRFREDCSGATAIEYGLIAGLTFLVFVGALKLYGSRMDVMYKLIGDSISGASS